MPWVRKLQVLHIPANMFACMSLIPLNCIAFVLSPKNHNPDSPVETSITLHLIVTISENLNNTLENVEVGSSQAPDYQDPDPLALVASRELPNLEARAEAVIKNASTSLTQVNSRFAPRLNQLPSDKVSGGAGAVAGLASILSNLEGFFKIADLLVDVINSFLHS